MRHIPTSDNEMPSVEAIELAVQMMKAPGAPTFPTKRDKRDATVELARQLWRSGKPKR
jgi:hypothetical protein